MAVVIRWISAIMAVLIGLPTLLGAVIKSVAKVGYVDRPVTAIS